MDDLEGQHRKVTKTILLAQLFLESIDDLKDYTVLQARCKECY